MINYGPCSKSFFFPVAFWLKAESQTAAPRLSFIKCSSVCTWTHVNARDGASPRHKTFRRKKAPRSDGTVGSDCTVDQLREYKHRPEGTPKPKGKSPGQESKTTLTQTLRHSDRRKIQQINRQEKSQDSHRGFIIWVAPSLSWGTVTPTLCVALPTSFS